MASVGNVQAAGLQDWIQSFAESDFRFSRATSNVPFPPMAWVNQSQYGDTSFSSPPGAAAGASFDQAMLSEAALVPFLAGSRDAFVVGEWVSLTRFDTDSVTLGSFDAISVSLPLAWVRQYSATWQLAAFVAPLGHKASLQGSAWSWEYMGGTFGRYTAHDNLSWILGFFADVAPGSNLYVPYLGASWVIDHHWTLSAVLPWPAILYAPTPDTLLRLGVSPSGASWALAPGSNEIRFDMDGWNLGIGLEHRLWRSLWMRVEGGISGFRGMSISGGKWHDPNSSLGSTPYVGIGFSFRPKLAHGQTAAATQTPFATGFP